MHLCFDISNTSDPIIRYNWIKSNNCNVSIKRKSLGLIEQNYIFNYATDKAIIATDDSNPILKWNYIFKEHEKYILDKIIGKIFYLQNLNYFGITN